MTPMSDKTVAPSASPDPIRTHAERMALAAEQRRRDRLLALAEQRLAANPPDVRIRAWEKLHGLQIPSNAYHPVLLVISQDTGLTLEQVRQEQRALCARRSGPRSG